ncbi:fibrinogen alpha chain-like isoform X1 [Huso huso]|uniref:Fibrinogen alpha chain-like isoform X1 n=1 Tax=Huso huso TaxID=61971 RepID=A0ABR1A9W4_HUSHU
MLWSDALVCKRGREQPAAEPSYGPKTGYQRPKTGCYTKKEFPACSDDDWASTCPSGCRMQGLINMADRTFFNRVNKICQFLQENENNTEHANNATSEAYAVIRKNVIQNYVTGIKYLEKAEELYKNITALKQHTAALAKKIRTLHSSIQQQVNEIHKTEVDIDIKIRACKGSCAKLFVYSIDRESYLTLDKHLSQFDSITKERGKPAELRVVKMRPINEATLVSKVYTSLPRKGNMVLNHLEDIEPYQLALEN